jgi:site-specific recombinase XerD
MSQRSLYSPPSLPSLLRLFFLHWLGEQQNASPKTVEAYRDAWRLFLRFVSDRKRKGVAQLRLEDLDESEVLAFLEHIEKTRKVSIATRNCRLAALRSFFSFVANREPLAAEQCVEVLRIPFKRKPKRAMVYLEPVEVAAILAQPDKSILEGQRDHVLLSLLYNTGSRIEEALNLCPQDFHFATPSHVRLFGKGRKERIAPLWPETVNVLRALLRRQPRQPNEQVFLNRYGTRLSPSGFRYRLRQYIIAAARKQPSLARKKITPHSFRHTIAVHLVSSGVDVTVIRSWLGHAHLSTTNIYAEANLEAKRRALEQVDPKLRRNRAPRWKRDAHLMEWLDSL